MYRHIVYVFILQLCYIKVYFLIKIFFNGFDVKVNKDSGTPLFSFINPFRASPYDLSDYNISAIYMHTKLYKNSFTMLFVCHSSLMPYYFGKICSFDTLIKKMKY